MSGFRLLILRFAGLIAASVVLSLLPEAASRLGEPDPHGNLAARASLSFDGVMGRPEWIVRGPLLAEGTRSMEQRSLLFGDSQSWLELDFGREVEIAAMLLQAEGDDRYAVEVAGADGAFEAVWTVEANSEAGLRTRHRELELRARRLRVQPSGAVYGDRHTLSGIRVYAARPEGWPRPEDTRPRADAGAWPWLDLDQVEAIKVALAFSGVFVFLSLLALDRRGGPRLLERGASALLPTLALFSSLGWWNFLQLSNENYHRTHRHYLDVFPYYMSTKYAPELGYTNLYRCMLAADSEAGFRAVRLSLSQVRDLETNDLVPTQRLLGESGRCREHFSEMRWAAFARDQAWFRTRLPPAAWLSLALDHGYNGSPVWTIAGYALGNLGPISDLQFFVLSSLDTLLLVALWALVWSTFGTRAASIAMLFWATNLVGNDHQFTVGAMLRIDWLFLSVAGVCCLKRDRPALAGGLLAWATLSRIFPGFLLVGLACSIALDVIQRRSTALSSPQRRLVAGAATTALALTLASTVPTGGFSAWSDFARNTLKHHETAQLQNVGLRALIAHVDQPLLLEKPRALIREVEASYQSPAREALAIALGVIFLPLLLLAVKGEEAWVAAVLGLTWLPFVTDINNYYWSVTLLFGLLAARRTAVAIGFGAVTLVFSWLGLAYPHSGLGIYTWASLALVLFFALAAAAFALPKLELGRRLSRSGRA